VGPPRTQRNRFALEDREGSVTLAEVRSRVIRQGRVALPGKPERVSVNEDLNMTHHRWYARPVFFVSDVQSALRYYIDKLGFEKQWHEADGKGGVCQINRGECEIILCEDAARRDRGRLFVELTPDGLEQLRHELVERAVPTEKTWWGYDVIRIADPDGNELLFPSE
jgi:catechol 2,3-dioxygenase-like lactoylglutathione lyase family enzyme